MEIQSCGGACSRARVAWRQPPAQLRTARKTANGYGRGRRRACTWWRMLRGPLAVDPTTAPPARRLVAVGRGLLWE